MPEGAARKVLGDDLRAWFELFDGIAVFRPRAGGGHDFDGWLSWSDIEDRFNSGKLKFAGVPYDSQNRAQRNKLIDAHLNYAHALVCLRLLERRRRL